MDITWRVFSGEGEGRNRQEKVQGGRSIIDRYKIDGQIKSFPDKVKLKEFIITKSLLCEMFKGLI